MSEYEKQVLADEFVRKAVRHLSSGATEEEIALAIRKAASSLPPYPELQEEELAAA